MRKIELDDTHKFFTRWFPELAPHAGRFHIMYMGSVVKMRPWILRPFLDVVDDIRRAFAEGKTHIVLNNWAETMNGEWLAYGHRMSNQFPDVPADRFIYLTSGIDAEQDYQEYTKKFKIKRPLKILATNLWENFVREQIEVFTNNNIYKQTNFYQVGLRNKLCLFLNRNPRPHRIELLAHFFDNFLIWRSHVSFAGNFRSEPWKLTNSVLPADSKVRTIIQKNALKLPIVLNMKDGTENPITIKSDDDQYFNTSYFSLVTETLWQQEASYGIWEEFNGHFFSEKIFKPILMKHPFILASRPGSLAKLRSLGYRSFSPHIDETYDTIHDPKARIQAIISEVKRLGEFSDQEWIQWQKNVKEIVEHNYITLLFRYKPHDYEDLAAHLGLQ